MAVDRTLILIRERSYFDLLDLGLVLVRRRPWPIALACLGGCLPFAALNWWLVGLDPEFPWVLYLFLLILEAPWATAPLTIVLGGLMFGDRPTFAKVLKALFHGFVPMFLYQGLLRLLLVCIPILLPYIPCRFPFVNEVILLERGRWRKLYERSGVLCGDRGGDFFIRCLGQLVFGAAFVTAFWWAWQVFRQVAVVGDGWEEIEGPNFYIPSVQVGIWVAVCFFSVTRFLTYIDQRIRLEGWEVELRLRQVAATMAEAEKW